MIHFAQRYGMVLWAIVFMSILFLHRTAQMNSYVNFWLFVLWIGIGLGWLGVLRSNGLSVLSTPLDIGLVLIIVALASTSVFSIDPSRSFRMAFQWISLIVAFYIIVTFFRTVYPHPDVVRIVYIITIIVPAILSYLWLSEWLASWYGAFGFQLGIPRPPRLSSLVSPNILAVWLNFVLFLGWGIWESKSRPWWGALLFIFFFPLLILTGSRSGWLGFFVGSLTLLIGNWWRQSQQIQNQFNIKQIARLLIGILGAIALFVALLVFLRPETLRTTSNLSILYRGEFWSIALDMWHQSPLLGQGLDTFGTFFMLNNQNAPPATPFRAAHSWWMSLLAETGLFGLGSAIICWFLLGQWLWKHRAPAYWTQSTISLLAALSAFTIHATFDTPEVLVIFPAAVWLAMLIVTVNDQPQVELERNGDTKKTIRYVGWPVVIWLFVSLSWIITYPSMRQYEAGLSAGQQGDWLLASRHFADAQAITPYTDTGIALAESLALGRLALTDETFLPSAIDSYERLIAHEPGWPSNHANLAALYWQLGEDKKAIMLMKQAHEISPNVPVYLLNLGLWYEEIGEEALAIGAYQSLANLPNIWTTTDFWYATEARRAAVPLLNQELDPAWIALRKHEFDLANQLYNDALHINPSNSSAYLGLGIYNVLAGQEDIASILFTQAKLLKNDKADIWLLAQADPELLFLDYFRYHSTRGIGQGRISTYPILLLVRPSLPYDLLPQLKCFSLDEPTSQHLYLLDEWTSSNNQLIEKLMASETMGVVSCYPLSE